MVLKRIFDIAGALAALIFIIPFTPFIAAAILIEDGRPVFVRLKRISGGRVIRLYKFRTMIRGAEAKKKDLLHLNERKDGPFFKIKNDPRLTKTGKFLRKLRLDEFPQAINVLKNELSIVGPRPHEPEEVKYYPADYKKILLYKGGVTGLSQVSGASGLPFKKELDLDLYYTKNKNFWLDLKILFKTIWIFFSDPTGV